MTRKDGKKLKKRHRDGRKNNGSTQRDDDGFTKKEKRFIKAYCVTFNATKAAREAGYGVGKKCEKGWRLLQSPKIRDAIHKRIAKREKKLDLKADDVLRQYMRMAFFNPAILYDKEGDFVGIHNLPPQAQMMIKRITRKQTKYGIEEIVEVHDAPAALEKCALHLGMMLPKLKVDVNEKKLIEISLKKEELKELGVEKLIQLREILSTKNRPLLAGEN